MAAAASSAPISCLGEALEDGLAAGCGVGAGRGRRGGVLVGLVRAVAGPEAERPDERLDAAADGRVGDAELALHVAEVAARAEEALEQRELLPRQPPEPADAELALQGRAAGAAVEARHGELAGADGTGGDDVVRHGGSFDSFVV